MTQKLILVFLLLKYAWNDISYSTITPRVNNSSPNNVSKWKSYLSIWVSISFSDKGEKIRGLCIHVVPVKNSFGVLNLNEQPEYAAAEATYKI